ncbi:phasin family protein [Rhodopseudomonas palustris]|uniref:phasin family protein n=1 Tax=Rhodopseudomonas palustris TaxID=1076 RepID=UPI002ACE8913|nr:phasin family protein [Rhodopseudomonas palustris]WQG98904.1 phasin family protein [Rhodopseudomonas palustris]
MADKDSSDVILNMMSKNLEQARGAMNNYLQFIEKSLSVSPMGTSSQANTLKGYVERNVQATFDFSEQLLHAKDFQDVVRIQTEFLQTQFRVLTDQAKDVVEMTKPTVIVPRDG